MSKIIIMGSGGHAKVIVDIIKRLKNLDIVGYVDMKDNNDCLGVPYLGTDNDLTLIKEKFGATAAVIAMAGLKSVQVRQRLHKQLLQASYQLPSITSLGAYVSSFAIIKDGAVVMERCVVNPHAVIDICSVINTGAIVEHDCHIGAYVHIAPGAVLCGSVKVGARSFIGANSVIKEGITIAEDVVVGAGSVVVKDIVVAGTYAANPAQALNRRS